MLSDRTFAANIATMIESTDGDGADGFGGDFIDNPMLTWESAWIDLGGEG
jgi:hypothetical protein